MTGEPRGAILQLRLFTVRLGDLAEVCRKVLKKVLVSWYSACAGGSQEEEWAGGAEQVSDWIESRLNRLRSRQCCLHLWFG